MVSELVKRHDEATAQNTLLRAAVFQCAQSLNHRLPAFVQAVTAIEIPGIIHSSELTTNKFYVVLYKFFSKEWQWKGPILHISKDSFKDKEAVQVSIQTLAEIVEPLYEIADDILDAELSGIASHNWSHIRFVMDRFQELCELVEVATGKEVSLRDRLVGFLTIELHDLMQTIAGRKDHGARIRLIADQLLIAGDDVGKQIIDSILYFVENHETSHYDFGADEMPYAGMILADEAHIQQKRLTEQGKINFLSGRGDDWKFMNFYSLESKWVLDETRKPQWRIQLDINSPDSIHHFISAFGHLLPSDAVITTDSIGLNFAQVFSQEVLRKMNLFKSAVRKLFGSPEFSVLFIDENGNELTRYHFGRLTTMPRNPQ